VYHLFLDYEKVGSPFKAKISTSKLFYKRSDPVTLHFELTNVGEKDFYILDWLTPLEGFRNDFLRVIHEKKELRYRGILVKRGHPTLKNYIFVPAGGSVNSSLVINEAYDVTQPGVYMVVLETSIMDSKQVSSLTDLVPSKLDGFHNAIPIKSNPVLVVVL